MDSEFLKSAGERIRVVRERSGLSQDAVGVAAGLNRNHVGRIERGLQNMSLTTLGRLAAALSTTPSNLLRGVAALTLEEAPRRATARGIARSGGDDAD